MQAPADSAPFGDAEACGTGLTASGLLNAASPHLGRHVNRAPERTPDMTTPEGAAIGR